MTTTTTEPGTLPGSTLTPADVRTRLKGVSAEQLERLARWAKEYPGATATMAGREGGLRALARLVASALGERPLPARRLARMLDRRGLLQTTPAEGPFGGHYLALHPAVVEAIGGVASDAAERERARLVAEARAEERFRALGGDAIIDRLYDRVNRMWHLQKDWTEAFRAGADSNQLVIRAAEIINERDALAREQQADLDRLAAVWREAYDRDPPASQRQRFTLLHPTNPDEETTP